MGNGVLPLHREYHRNAHRTPGKLTPQAHRADLLAPNHQRSIAPPNPPQPPVSPPRPRFP